MPTVREMREGDNPPTYPSSGCKACDGLRRYFRNPDVFCLRHDPSIPEETRKWYRVQFEALTKTVNNKENEHA